MTSIANVVVVNCILATALALIAYVVGRVSRRPALCHCLWLLVLVKLITPAVIEFRVDVAATRRVYESVSPGKQPLGSVVQTSSDSVDNGASADSHANSGRETAWPGAIRGEANWIASSIVAARRMWTRASDFAVNTWRFLAARVGVYWPVFLFLWVVGSVVYLVRQIGSSIRFVAFLRTGQSAPEELRRSGDRLAREMGLRSCPTIWTIDANLSPMLWAVGWRAKIILPRPLITRMSLDMQKTLLAHELAHYGRRDHWVRVLEFIVTGLFWWHPVVWWARHEIEMAEEKCCDAWVLHTFPDFYRRYAEALLDTVDYLAGSRRPVATFASGIGSVPLIEQRLTTIFREAPPRSMTRVHKVVVVVLSLAFLPIYPRIGQTVVSSAASLPSVARSVAKRPSKGKSIAAGKSATVPARDSVNIWAITPDGRNVVIVYSGFGDENVPDRVDNAMFYSDSDLPTAFLTDIQRFTRTNGRASVYLWDRTSSDESVQRMEWTDPRGSVEIGPRAMFASVITGGDGLSIFDLKTMTRSMRLRSDSGGIEYVRFSGDGRLIGFSTVERPDSHGGRVEVWDLESQTRLARIACESAIDYMCFSADRRVVVTRQLNGHVGVWDLTAGKRLVSIVFATDDALMDPPRTVIPSSY